MPGTLLIESEEQLREFLDAEELTLVEFFEDPEALEHVRDLDWLMGLAIEASIDRAFADVPNYKMVTPGAKKKLSGLMAHYAKKAHPFTACVNDNTKRFGKDRAERICAVLKDLIRGTTSWRGDDEKKLAEFHFADADARADFLEWIEDVDERAFFDPDQRRGPDGKWVDEGVGGGVNLPSIEPVTGLPPTTAARAPGVTPVMYVPGDGKIYRGPEGAHPQQLRNKLGFGDKRERTDARFEANVVTGPNRLGVKPGIHLGRIRVTDANQPLPPAKMIDGLEAEYPDLPLFWNGEPFSRRRDFAAFETVDLDGVHLLSSGGPYFGAGSPKEGDFYKDADLQRVANNNNALIAAGELHPFVKVGHNEEQRLLKESGYYEDEKPATGDLRNFRVEGGKLLADAKGVPKKLAQLIGARAFPLVR